MSYQLKNLFDALLVRAVANELHRVCPQFRQRVFATECIEGLSALELTQRAWHIADRLYDHLPRPFSAAAAVLVESLGPELIRSDGFGLAPLRYMPHVFFVQRYGLDDFEVSMRAQYELTKRFSAESSIRAFLVKYPQQTYARLREWAEDENVHVRRLVSEGTRPRLPWAPRLRAFQEDPRPVIALLELLKDDSERYVQRSVANNLNDISKDHPDLVVEVCGRWSRRATPSRAWVVKHALRSLVKDVHSGALKILGVGNKPQVRISKARLSSPSVRRGGIFRFAFEIASRMNTGQELLVDYAVHFVKANGATRRKVFKLRKLVLAPAGRCELTDTISFRRMTTRRHYPGRHHIDVLINGVVYPLVQFDLR